MVRVRLAGSLAGRSGERERLAPCYLFVMDERERRIAEDVLLAFLIENAESPEDRAGWERERARRDGRASQGGTMSEPSPAIKERLAAIMSARPAHICGAHWLQRMEGA
jgi:hypothetical protein